MNLRAIFPIILFAMFSQSCADGDQLSASQVRETLTRLDTALNSQDLDNYKALLSTDFKAEVTSSSGTKTYDRDSLMALLVLDNSIESYQVERTEESLDIDRNNEATIVSTLKETIVAGGKEHVGHSRESTYVKKVDGRPVIFLIESRLVQLDN